TPGEMHAWQLLARGAVRRKARMPSRSDFPPRRRHVPLALATLAVAVVAGGFFLRRCSTSVPVEGNAALTIRVPRGATVLAEPAPTAETTAPDPIPRSEPTNDRMRAM